MPKGQPLCALEHQSDQLGLLDSSQYVENKEHRTSCHRCGNIRKNNLLCVRCPHIYCNNCSNKMMAEHGDLVFLGGCPVCKELCCCGDKKSIACTRQYHCYKKCPATRPPNRRSSAAKRKKSPRKRTNTQTSDSLFSSYDVVSETEEESTTEESGEVADYCLTSGSQRKSTSGSLHVQSSPSRRRGGRTYSGIGKDTSSASSSFLVTPMASRTQLSGAFDEGGYEPSPTKRKRQGGPGVYYDYRGASPIMLPLLHFGPAMRQPLPPPPSTADDSLFSGILAPQSLTLETNPFFVQNAHGMCHPLQSIQPLIERSAEQYCRYLHPFDNRSLSVPPTTSGCGGAYLEDVFASSQDRGLGPGAYSQQRPDGSDTTHSQRDSLGAGSPDYAFHASSANYWDLLDNMHNHVHSSGRRDTSCSSELSERGTRRAMDDGSSGRDGRGNRDGDAFAHYKLPSSASLYSLDREGVLFGTPHDMQPDTTGADTRHRGGRDEDRFSATSSSIDINGNYQSAYTGNNACVFGLTTTGGSATSPQQAGNPYSGLFSTPGGATSSQREAANLALGWTGGSLGSLCGMGFGPDLFSPMDPPHPPPLPQGQGPHNSSQRPRARPQGYSPNATAAVGTPPQTSSSNGGGGGGGGGGHSVEGSPMMDLETYTLFSSLFNDMTSDSEASSAYRQKRGKAGPLDLFASPQPRTPVAGQHHTSSSLSQRSSSETPFSVYSCSSSVFNACPPLITTASTAHSEVDSPAAAALSSRY